MVAHETELLHLSHLGYNWDHLFQGQTKYLEKCRVENKKLQDFPFDQKSHFDKKENKWVNLKEVPGWLYLFSFPLRTWSPALWLLEQDCSGQRPQDRAPQADTAGAQRKHRADRLNQCERHFLTGGLHSQIASGATNKLLGILILKGLSNIY